MAFTVAVTSGCQASRRGERRTVEGPRDAGGQASDARPRDDIAPSDVGLRDGGSPPEDTADALPPARAITWAPECSRDVPPIFWRPDRALPGPCLLAGSEPRRPEEIRWRERFLYYGDGRLLAEVADCPGSYGAAVPCGVQWSPWVHPTHGVVLHGSHLTAGTLELPSVATIDGSYRGRTPEHLSFAWDVVGVLDDELHDHLDVTMTFDEAGRLSLVDWHHTGREESYPRSSFSYTYGAEGGLTLWEQHRVGDDGRYNGQAFEYDEAGRLSSRETDSDADGEPDEAYRFVWNDRGLLETERHDLDGDGFAEEALEHEYDRRGWREQTVTYEVDPFGRNAVRSRVFFRDDYGNLLEEKAARYEPNTTVTWAVYYRYGCWADLVE